MPHRRPSPARQGVAGTAAALVLGYLAGIVLLNQLLLRLAPALGAVGAYAVIVALVLVGTAGYVLLGRRFAHLDSAEHDHVQHAVDTVDGQVAMLVRAGVDQDEATRLVRDQLVRALTPRTGGSPLDALLGSGRHGGHGGPPKTDEAATANGGQYL